MHETAVPEEVRREKIVIPDEMTVDQIQEKYSFSRAKSRNAKKTGFF